MSSRPARESGWARYRLPEAVVPSLNPPALVPEPVLQGTSARSSDPERPLLGPAVLRPSCPHTPHARGGCVESCPVAGVTAGEWGAGLRAWLSGAGCARGPQLPWFTQQVSRECEGITALSRPRGTQRVSGWPCVPAASTASWSGSSPEGSRRSPAAEHPAARPPSCAWTCGN